MLILEDDCDFGSGFATTATVTAAAPADAVCGIAYLAHAEHARLIT